MEITSFALGMLSMVALMVISAIVVGLVGVRRLYKNVGEITTHILDLDRRFDNILRETNNRIDHNMNITDQLFKNFEDHLKDVSEEKDRQISESFRTIETEKKEILSYVDSRLDKLINTLNK